MSPEIKIGNSLSDDLHTLARACRILNLEGHADMTLGHLSLRDPEGRGLWLKRSGIGLGEVRGVDDFTLIDFGGRQLAGSGRVHIEWPIHAAVLRQRKDLNVVAHTHPFHACLFSATGEKLRAVSHEAAYLGGEVARFEASAGLIDNLDLGAALASAMGTAPAVLMRNHGVTFGGRSIAEATLIGIFLEKACKAQLALGASGLAYRWAEAGELSHKRDQLMTPALIDNFWDFYNRALDHQERA